MTPLKEKLCHIDLRFTIQVSISEDLQALEPVDGDIRFDSRREILNYSEKTAGKWEDYFMDCIKQGVFIN